MEGFWYFEKGAVQAVMLYIKNLRNSHKIFKKMKLARNVPPTILCVIALCFCALGYFFYYFVYKVFGCGMRLW